LMRSRSVIMDHEELKTVLSELGGGRIIFNLGSVVQIGKEDGEI
jgi:hypothetical protein